MLHQLSSSSQHSQRKADAGSMGSQRARSRPQHSQRKAVAGPSNSQQAHRCPQHSQRGAVVALTASNSTAKARPIQALATLGNPRTAQPEGGWPDSIGSQRACNRPQHSQTQAPATLSKLAAGQWKAGARSMGSQRARSSPQQLAAARPEEG